MKIINLLLHMIRTQCYINIGYCTNTRFTLAKLFALQTRKAMYWWSIEQKLECAEIMHNGKNNCCTLLRTDGLEAHCYTRF